MTAAPTSPCDMLLTEAIRAEAEALMSDLARLPLRWDTRAARAELRAEADGLIGRYNLLVLGR